MFENADPKPVLFAGDLVATSRFYKELLGFTATVGDHRLSLARDNMTILYCHRAGRACSMDLSVILKTENIRALHSEYVGSGVPMISPLHSPFRQPLLFQLHDLNGGTLTFVSKLPQLTVVQGGAVARDGHRPDKR